jgi:hypothetical protein
MTVAVVATLSAAIAIVAKRASFEPDRLSQARTLAKTIQTAVVMYGEHEDGRACPNLSDLITAGMMVEGAQRVDPWGTPWRIDCLGESVTVRSSGPDRREGTADDISAPAGS